MMLLPNRSAADSGCILKNDWENGFASPGENLKNPGGFLNSSAGEMLGSWIRKITMRE
jgi:hypothetical protein